ncbi:hypothetical protein EST38_g9352 [Candolleomyces aberdarensis]|uniref:Uncharacterized protein n=1 Tax=Candolleomyces aberdarensis TaxID=2316362 RepID=A0A4Q2DBW3_9AGAR|nr:hypothetical protein EST38_g9352 [Candolleomyces aberdarensis]
MRAQEEFQASFQATRDMQTDECKKQKVSEKKYIQIGLRGSQFRPRKIPERPSGPSEPKKPTQHASASADPTSTGASNTQTSPSSEQEPGPGLQGPNPAFPDSQRSHQLIVSLDLLNPPALTSPMNPNDLPIALRRTRRNLERFRTNDQLSEPLRTNQDTFLPPAGNPFKRLQAFRSSLPKPAHIEGPANTFHLRRRYYSTSLPTHDPEGWINLDDLYDSTNHANTPEEASHNPPSIVPPALMGPFPNLSSFELGEWYIDSGPDLSIAKLQKLVQLAHTPGFAEDIAKANWPRIFDVLGDNRKSLEHIESTDDEEDWVDDDGWKTTPIAIPVPIGGTVERRNVGTLYHRSIVSIVQEKILNSPDMDHFHYDPFEVLWQPNPDTPAMRVHSELYNSDAFLQAHRELQDSPPPPGCTRPRVVVGLMLWSDQTHLTSFSDEKLWPLYMFFGNESKYRRCKPSSNLCHIVAFFDKLSPDFKDYNEMFHAQWQILLDDELLEAIRHGIVIMCQDGIERRFYIRIFTYSADYPEKVLIATIRYNGGCPCPRCLITKDKLDQLGTEADRTFREDYARRDDASRQSTVEEARIKVFNDGAAISGTHVERLLKAESLQPVMNAFSVRLKSTKFDIFSALVVDLMHEFEIGVWKSLFIHLIRILEASSKHDVLVHELDRRYRLVPRFGTSVRRFSENVSEFKRKAARDYEQLLQCAIPVFDGLVPHEEHSREILLILSSCAKWHALAKLRFHTDATLDLLDEATIKIGDSFWQFIANVCSQIQTKELAIEVAKRVKREQKKAASKAKLAKDKATADESGPSTAPPADCALPSTSTILEAPCSANPPPSLPETAARVIKTNKSRSGRSAALSGSRRKSKETKGKLRTSNGDIDQAKRTSGTQPSSSTFAAASDTVPPQSESSGPLESNQEMPAVPMAPEPSSSQPSESSNQQGSSKGKSVDSKAKAKLVALNIQTPKFHFLGDYVKNIRTFGTCDSFTTEVGELMHRLPKKWYRRSSKRKIREEVVRHERKAAHIRAIRARINASTATKKQIEEQRRAARKADIHHHIGVNENYPISLLGLSSIGEPQPSDVEADPLGKNGLKLEGTETHGTTPSLDPSYLAFKDNRIFSHKIMRLKYTTYDVRRDEDVIHVNSDVCNIMIPNPQYSRDTLAHHPYLCARVLGIYHAHVTYVGEAVSGFHKPHQSARFNFLLSS